MSYSELVRVCQRDLRVVKRQGFPDWAQDHVTSGLDHAAFIRAQCGSGKDYLPAPYWRAVNQVLAMLNVIRSFQASRASTKSPRHA